MSSLSNNCIIIRKESLRVFKNIVIIGGCMIAMVEKLEDREQLFGIGSLLPPVCGFGILNSGHQDCSASTFTH